jgi:4-hydroxybenzoate polyprenyltransferase
LLLLIGQYLTAVFVFEPDKSWRAILQEAGTHLTIWSAACILVFGFLINSFYDLETDAINRPKQTAFEQLVSRGTSLRIAGLALFTGLIMAFVVSWRGLMFYGFYAFLLWLYSHKLRNIPFLGHISAAVIGLLPFFGISVYHRYLSLHTLAFGGLIGLALFSRELLKDLLMVKGDTVMGKSTAASEFGGDQVRLALIISSGIAWIPALFTQQWFSPFAQLGMLLMLVLLSIANTITLNTKGIRGLRWAHLCYKVVLLLGILTIPFL